MGGETNDDKNAGEGGASQCALIVQVEDPGAGFAALTVPANSKKRRRTVQSFR